MTLPIILPEVVRAVLPKSPCGNLLKPPYYLQHAERRYGLDEQMDVVFVKADMLYSEMTVLSNVIEYAAKNLSNLVIYHLAPVFAHQHNMITEPRARVIYTFYVNI